MLKGKKILVTSGGTMEYIDDVRVMTNISTGKLGCRIAYSLGEADAKIFYVCGKNALQPGNDIPVTTIPVRTANDAMEAMKKIIIEEKIDAVVHAMAVSDFTFKRDVPIKCKSNDLMGFIDHMRDTIVPNPKIIGMIKQWRPETILVGFKFEVGISKEDLIALAKASIDKNGCDMVVANDKKEMQKLHGHIAHFIYSDKMIKEHAFSTYDRANNKDQIADWIKVFLDEVLD